MHAVVEEAEDADDLISLWAEGEKNRHSASTKMNDRSSRRRGTRGEWNTERKQRQTGPRNGKHGGAGAERKRTEECGERRMDSSESADREEEMGSMERTRTEGRRNERGNDRIRRVENGEKQWGRRGG